MCVICEHFSASADFYSQTQFQVQGGCVKSGKKESLSYSLRVEIPLPLLPREVGVGKSKTPSTPYLFLCLCYIFCFMRSEIV
jgi:hypothetical protein